MLASLIAAGVFYSTFAHLVRALSARLGATMDAENMLTLIGNKYGFVFSLARCVASDAEEWARGNRRIADKSRVPRWHFLIALVEHSFAKCSCFWQRAFSGQNATSLLLPVLYVERSGVPRVFLFGLRCGSADYCAGVSSSG